jgi:hypothetical protein
MSRQSLFPVTSVAFSRLFRLRQVLYTFQTRQLSLFADASEFFLLYSFDRICSTRPHCTKPVEPVWGGPVQLPIYRLPLLLPSLTNIQALAFQPLEPPHTLTSIGHLPKASPKWCVATTHWW